MGQKGATPQPPCTPDLNSSSSSSSIFLVRAPKEDCAQQSAATSHRSAKQDYDGVYNVSKGAPGKLHIVVGSWHMLRVCSRVQLTVLIMLTLQVGGSTNLRMDGCTTIIQIKQKRNG